VFFEADVDVHAVGPQVDVVDLGQIPGGERALLGLPLPGQPSDDRGGQPGGRAEELAEGGHEVPARQTVQVQQRQHLGDARGLPRPRRQDRRGEPLALTGLGAIRLSLTRGALTSIAPALVSTSRDWCEPFRTTRRRPRSSRSSMNWAM
jgi:hypothetical protein